MKKRMVKKRDIDSILVFYYSRKLEKSPDSFMFLPLADMYRRKGMPELAIQTCLKGLKFHPVYTSARMLLGLSYYDCERFDDAERELRMVADSAADNILARRVLSDIYRRKGRIDDALKEMEAIVSIAPGNKDFKMLRENLQKLFRQHHEVLDFKGLKIEDGQGEGVRLKVKEMKDEEKPSSLKMTEDTGDMEKLLDDSGAFEEIGKLFSSKNKESLDEFNIDTVGVLENWLKNIERGHNESADNKRT